MNTPSSGSINSVVRLRHAEPQQGMRLDLRERRPADASRTRLRRAEISSRESLVDDSGKERRETTLGAAVFNYLMESFAMAGASLYPTAYFPTEAYIAAEADIRQQDSLQPGPKETTSSAPTRHRREAAPEPDVLHANLSHADRGVHGAGFTPVSAALSACRELPSPAIAPSSHWGWLTSSWQVFDTLWAHWRSEREIRKAVEALAELDDRTLRDMGIPHRSQIEYTVRYCRNC